MKILPAIVIQVPDFCVHDLLSLRQFFQKIHTQSWFMLTAKKSVIAVSLFQIFSRHQTAAHFDSISCFDIGKCQIYWHFQVHQDYTLQLDWPLKLLVHDSPSFCWLTCHITCYNTSNKPNSVFLLLILAVTQWWTRLRWFVVRGHQQADTTCSLYLKADVIQNFILINIFTTKILQTKCFFF